MQVLRSLLRGGGEESLAHHQPELGHFGGHQGHDEQGEQDGRQRNDRGREQQLGFGKALLLKQGHRVGKVSSVVFLDKSYAY